MKILLPDPSDSLEAFSELGLKLGDLLVHLWVDPNSNKRTNHGLLLAKPADAVNETFKTFKLFKTF